MTIRRKREPRFNHAQLLARISYNPETGIFMSLISNSPALPTGRVARDGYRKIRIDSQSFQAGRLAWFYVMGIWPAHTIDHKDLNKANDAFDNLREATQSQNNANKASRSPIAKGVRRYGKKYQAMFCRKYLGTFATIEEASAAYQRAASENSGRNLCV